MPTQNSGGKRASAFVVRVWRFFVMFVAVCFFISAVRLVYIVAVHGKEYKTVAENAEISDTSIQTSRGTIYDSQMNVLAESAVTFTCFVDPKTTAGARNNTVETDDSNKKKGKTPTNYTAIFDGDIAYLTQKLAEILSIDEQTITDALSHTDKYYIKLADNVSASQRAQILKLQDDIEEIDNAEYNAVASQFGVKSIVGFDDTTRRYYPYGAFASQLIGFKNVNGDAWGLEKYYDSVLDGTAGRSVAYKHGTDNVLSSKYESVNDAQEGCNLVLTLNNTIQGYLQDALDGVAAEYSAQYAAGIVMDVKTGAILGMGVSPDFDLNSYGSSDPTVWNNLCVTEQGFLQPGSVFKMFLVAAGLDEGIIDDNTSYYCNGSISAAGFTYNCYHNESHGREDLCDLLVNSCNCFAVTVGQKLGAANFFKYYQAFGFTEKTGIDTANEATPTATDRNTGHYGQYFDPSVDFNLSNLCGPAFGETTYMTPIQIITAVSAIANGGSLMTPYVVDKTTDSSGNTVTQTQPTVRRQVISAQTSKTLRSYLEQVTLKGTGTNAYVPGYHVAIKTGTAKTDEDGQVMASIAGFAPADDPEIAILLDVYKPQGSATSGGVVAAPYGGELFEKILKYLNVEPSYSDSELAMLTAETPDVTGETVDDAKSALEKSGFETKVVGSGSVVVTQTPESGREIPRNGIVVLYTESGETRSQVTVPDFTGMSLAQASSAALSAGINIQLSGSGLEKSDCIAYKQSTVAGNKIDMGEVVTVSFRSSDVAGD